MSIPPDKLFILLSSFVYWIFYGSANTVCPVYNSHLKASSHWTGYWPEASGSSGRVTLTDPISHRCSRCHFLILFHKEGSLLFVPYFCFNLLIIDPSPHSQQDFLIDSQQSFYILEEN